MPVDTRPGVVTIAVASARLLTELVNAEIEVRAKAPCPTHLVKGGLNIELLDDGQWRARLEFE